MPDAEAGQSMTVGEARALLAAIEGERERRAARKRRDHLRRQRRLALDAEDDFRAFVTWTHPGYVWDEFHERLAALLQWVSDEILAGRAPRVICEGPPQHGKTAQISERFPVWHMARAARKGMRHDVLLASYSADLAQRNSRTARSVARDVAEFWPATVIRHNSRRTRSKDTDAEWHIGNGAACYAAGRGGSLTGKGGHLGIIDDIVKDAMEADSERVRDSTWAWWQSVFSSRIRAGGGIIVMMTRWHEDDLIGRLLREHPDEWIRVRFPAVAEVDERDLEYVPGVKGWRNVGEALAPSLFDLQALQRKKDGLKGGRWWAAMYQARPSPAEGTAYRRSMFRHRYDHDPQRPPMPYGVVSLVIDANFKEGGSSRAAGVVWGREGMAGDGFDVLDVPILAALGYPDLVRAVKDSVLKWGPHELIIEDKANGSALIAQLGEDLRALCKRHGIRLPVVVSFSPGNTSKGARAEVTSYRWAAGECRLPRAAPWTGDFVEEHVRFLPGRNTRNDLVDCGSMYLLHATTGQDGRRAVDKARGMAALFGVA